VDEREDVFNFGFTREFGLRFLPLQTRMSHWKCTLLLSGNLNMEYNSASATPFNTLYSNVDMIVGSGHLIN